MPPRPIKGPAALEKARRRAATSVKTLKQAREQRQRALDKASTTAQASILQPSKSISTSVKEKPPPPAILRGNVASYPSRILTLTAAKAARSATPDVSVQTPSLTLRPTVKPPLSSSRRFQRVRGRTTRQVNAVLPQGITNWKGYVGRPTIFEMQSLFGLPGSTRAGQGPAPNSVIIAIDTETERQGLISQVVEIGVTVLRLKDIVGVEPGTHARAWLAKSEHRHMVIAVTQRPRTRMRGSLFGRSHFVDAAAARKMLRAILQACADGKPLPEGPESVDIEADGKSGDFAVRPGPQADLWIVGQSIDGDLKALAGRPVQLDITKPAVLGGVSIWSIIDILPFSRHAVAMGARLRNSKLGHVVRFLGADAAYHDPVKPTIVGWHNASNDAAYTMMALLLYAVRWDHIIAPAPPQSVRKQSIKWFGLGQSNVERETVREAAHGVARQAAGKVAPRQGQGSGYAGLRRGLTLLVALSGMAGCSAIAYVSVLGE